MRSRAEFSALVAEIVGGEEGCAHDAAEVDALFDALDLNHNGMVDVHELKRALRVPAPPAQPAPTSPDADSPGASFRGRRRSASRQALLE